MREHNRRFCGFLLAACLLALAACGGGARLAPETPGPAAMPEAGPAAPAGGTARNLLRLETPELARLQAGSEFEVALSATTIEPLFQASARVLFDPAQLEPLSAAAAPLGAGCVTLTRADAALRMDASGYIPYAFTGMPETGGIAAGRHELLRVRFRVRQPLTRNAGLRLLNDPAYLQLRASDGRRLGFDLSEEVAAR